MNEEEMNTWILANWNGKAYFRQPDYQCFDERPLSSETWQYAAGDVDHLIRLHDLLAPKPTANMMEVINNATFRELKEASGDDKPITGSDAPKEFSIFYPMRKKEWEPVSDPREPQIPPEGDYEEEFKEDFSQVPDSWEAAFVAGRTGKIQE
ncbi:uncharacterized protein RAG0_08363 [Rhynchosporium agropyri]|uniref:Uncharacterized protein n=1 Tax=Rhynchosporium agropyri TaxID=914238 RepID=A0A1E1KTJ6_9HELO|nr:uncharacterized protein RAG0_08363 [Rhynchosporium agropyri]